MAGKAHRAAKTASEARPVIHTTAQTPTATPFRLFDLPGELSNLIYQKIAEDQSAWLNPKIQLVDDSGILEIDELREEYYQMLLLHAGHIYTTVRDCNFRYIITFLNRLSEAELKALPTTTKPSTRSITVRLDLGFSEHQGRAALWRWLNRVEDTTKKGTKLDISYEPMLHRSTLNRRGPQRYIPLSIADSWNREIDNYLRWEGGERSHAEARKIKAAINLPYTGE